MGTMNRRSQKVQTPVAGIAPSDLTILTVRLTANFSSLFGWLRVPPSPEGLAEFRCGLPVCGPSGPRGAGGVAAGLAVGLAAGLSCGQSVTRPMP